MCVYVYVLCACLFSLSTYVVICSWEKGTIKIYFSFLSSLFYLSRPATEHILNHFMFS